MYGKSPDRTDMSILLIKIEVLLSEEWGRYPRCTCANEFNGQACVADPRDADISPAALLRPPLTFSNKTNPMAIVTCSDTGTRLVRK